MQPLFCKFCGSSDIGKTQYRMKDMQDRTLEPEITFGIGPDGSAVNIGAKGGHITRKKTRELFHKTSFCRICRNIDAGIPSRESSQMELKSNTTNDLVIVPHALSVMLHNANVPFDEVALLLRSINKTLNKIYRKWQTSGVNPCKHNKVGRKLTFSITQNIIVDCWIIIDSIRNKTAFRLSYGGANIQCP